MALSSDPWDSTELIAYINEVWPGVVDQEYFAKPVLANFVRDLTSVALGQGGDIFHIPDVYTNPFSVQTQSTQATEVTTDAPATVDNKLTVNNHVYIATLLGDMDAQQIARSYDISEIYNRKAVGTLVEDLEGDLFANWSSLTTNTVGDTATVITDVELRLAIEKLETLNIPRDQLAFFFHPYSYYAQILAVQKFYDASQAGWMTETPIITSNFGPTASMQMARKGTLFGIPIFTSSKVVNTLLAVRNMLLFRDTMTYATQTPGIGRIRVQAANWLENLGTLVVWDMMNGNTVTYEKSGVVLNGNNAFVAS